MFVFTHLYLSLLPAYQSEDKMFHYITLNKTVLIFTPLWGSSMCPIYYYVLFKESHGNWFAVGHNSDLAEELNKKFKVKEL